MLSIVVISKDEPGLAETLASLETQAAEQTERVEVIVVDASRGRLEAIRAAHPAVTWQDFVPPSGVRISIPHQRNAGMAAANGDVIVFTDAGCTPKEHWLKRLVGPIREQGELVTAGLAVAPLGSASHYDLEVSRIKSSRYLDEAPTINLAFSRDVLAEVGGFDEHFEYGSDLDFTWRIVEHGFRIRSVPDAVVEHDWGHVGRQARRAFLYGQAKARLYIKHRSRRLRALRTDPVFWIYPVFILFLPLTVIFPAYPLLLVVPMWRARKQSPLWTVLDHLAFGAGVLATIVRR